MRVATTDARSPASGARDLGGCCSVSRIHTDGWRAAATVSSARQRSLKVGITASPAQKADAYISVKLVAGEFMSEGYCPAGFYILESFKDDNTGIYVRRSSWQEPWPAMIC